MKIKFIDLIFTLVLVLKIKCFDLELELSKLRDELSEPDLYLPKFDYSNPDTDSYEKISKYIGENNPKRNDIEPKDIFIANEEFKNYNQDIYLKRLTTELIKKEVNQEEIQYDRRYTLYGYPNATVYQQHKPKLAQSDDMVIRDISELGDTISFEPKMIYVRDKYNIVNIDLYVFQP